MSVGIFRNMAENLLGPLTVVRRLPAHSGGGAIVVNGRVGGLKYLLRRAANWDEELLNIADLLVRPGNQVWDIGANVGLFSKASAFRATETGSVLSLEADLDAVKLLSRTCLHRSPNHASMTVLPVAVSDEIGFVRFSISRRARASNSIEGFGSTQTGGVRETRTLPCVTLDHLLDHFRSPDVLKIDVEGAELMALRGASRVLSQSRPLIYCEVADPTRSEVCSWLERHEYDLQDGKGFDRTFRSQHVSSETSNLVAIPKERLEKLSGVASA